MTAIRRQCGAVHRSANAALHTWAGQTSDAAVLIELWLVPPPSPRQPLPREPAHTLPPATISTMRMKRWRNERPLRTIGAPMPRAPSHMILHTPAAPSPISARAKICPPPARVNARQPLACPRPPATTAAAAALSRRLLPSLCLCARRFPLPVLILLLLLIVRCLDGDLGNGDRAVGYRVEDRIAVERIHLPRSLHMLEQACTRGGWCAPRCCTAAPSCAPPRAAP